MKKSIILLLLITACSAQPKEPCPEQTTEQSLIKGAIAGYMVSKGYYVRGCI